MAGKVVADDDVSWAQRRAEYLLEVSQERDAIDRPVEHQGRHEVVLTQTAEESGGMPVPVRHASHQALAAKSCRPRPCNDDTPENPVLQSSTTCRSRMLLSAASTMRKLFTAS